MDSHEEKVYQAVRQTQEREAKQKMREKAKELQRQKYDTQKRGGGGGSGMGFGADSGSSSAFGGSQVRPRYHAALFFHFSNFSQVGLQQCDETRISYFPNV